MSQGSRLSQMTRAQYLGKLAPGLTSLLKYQQSDLPCDLRAGLSVAAVALPVGVAYAQLAGFNPAVGLYSSILPLLGYAIFGPSRQLIIGPDAATCALVAASMAPLASRDQTLYESLSVALAVLADLLSIGASFLKLPLGRIPETSLERSQDTFLRDVPRGDQGYQSVEALRSESP